MIKDFAKGHCLLIGIMCLAGCGLSRNSLRRNSPSAIPPTSLLPLALHNVKGEVQVGQTTIANEPDGSFIPLQMLGQAVQLDPESQRFRISWGLVATYPGCRATALYDRSKKHIKLYCDQPSFDDSMHCRGLYLLKPVNDYTIGKLCDSIASPVRYDDVMNSKKIHPVPLRQPPRPAGFEEMPFECWGGFSALSYCGAAIVALKETVNPNTR